LTYIYTKELFRVNRYIVPLDFSLCIDVTGKATLLLALRASVSGADAFVGL